MNDRELGDMDHRDRIERAVDFIERHLTESLAIGDIARCACFSPFHFQRVFQTLVGYSVKEYVRGRRLHEACNDLRAGNARILDIALKYQYETHESFTRAFKKQYRVTPRQFRANSRQAVAFERADLLAIKLRHGKGGQRMEPKIVERDEFKVIGVGLRTTTCDGENSRAIPEFWGRFLRDGMADKIPNRTQPKALLGMCADTADDGSFTYLICAEVNSFDDVPKGMVRRTVSAARYAVFTSRGKIPDSIQEMWRYILSTGLSKAGYEHAGTEDFELYDERFGDQEDSEVDIYIPVRI